MRTVARSRSPAEALTTTSLTYPTWRPERWRYSVRVTVRVSVVSLPAGATQAPFVNTITLSGTSANPTFTWAPPPATTVNGYRINIYDKALITADNNGQVTSRNVAPSITSYTVTGADFTVPGYSFQLGRNYSIEISLIQTKDGGSGNLGNDNLASISRVYADFRPSNSGGPWPNWRRSSSCSLLQNAKSRH